MGAKIALGRDFSDADGQPQPQAAPPANIGVGVPNAPPAAPPLPVIVILSHHYFESRYGSNPSILGQKMRVNGVVAPVIAGVLEPGFELYFPPDANVEQAPDYWIANRLAYDAALRNQVSLRVIGRLKPGITLERAQASADAASAAERRVDPIARTAGFHIRLEPMQQHLVAEVRPAILALMGAVIFLLLIACANVANLLLVRASLRERELAVRTALGGSRWRLVRQMLAEALLLAAAGTVLGAWLASVGIQQLHVIAPANLPRLESIRLDPVVLAFTALAGLAAATIFGLVPALRAARPDVMQRAPRQRPHCRPRRRTCAAQQRGRGRSRALLRPAHRIRTHVPQLSRAPAGRSRLRRPRPSHVPIARPRRPESDRSARRPCESCTIVSPRCPASSA